MTKMNQILILSAGILTFAISASALAESPPLGSTTFSVSGPITVVDGDAFFGANFNFMHEVVPNLSLGLESGFFYWSDSSYSASANQWFIPILPTLLYHFASSTNLTLTPFIGVSVGIAILHTSISADVLSLSETDTKFQTYAHLGLAFGADQRIFLDTKVGVVASNFMIAPTFGVSF